MGIFDPVVDFFADVAGPIRRAIKSAVDAVYEWVRSQIDWLVDQVNGVVDWANTAFEAVYGWIRDRVNEVYQWASGLVDGVVQWASNAFDAVYGWASDQLQGLIDWAAEAIGTIADGLNVVYQWVNDHVFQPLADAIEGAYHWVTETVIPWVGNAIGDALSPLWEVIMDAWHAAVEAVDWVRNAGHFVYDLVKGAEDFLRFVIEHPFDWWIVLIRDAFNMAPELLEEQQVSRMGGMFDHMEEWFIQWLGLLATLALALRASFLTSRPRQGSKPLRRSLRTRQHKWISSLPTSWRKWSKSCGRPFRPPSNRF